VQALGLPVHRMPSGAGHDAMKLHEVMPQAMLFVRGGNAGISHNPLETITNDDAELCVRAFQHLLEELAEKAPMNPPRRRPTPRRLDRRPLRRGGALPAGTGAGAHRHAARQQRAARRAHGRAAGRHGLVAEKHPVPAAEVQAYGLQSITNLIVRRRYGAGGPVIALNAHGDVVPPGEGWTHDPYGARSWTASSTAARRR
jgi:acetylornithine deacetylase/succinyl-diaminopimelate desuccinylase-like protein